MLGDQVGDRRARNRDDHDVRGRQRVRDGGFGGAGVPGGGAVGRSAGAEGDLMAGPGERPPQRAADPAGPDNRNVPRHVVVLPAESTVAGARWREPACTVRNA